VAVCGLALGLSGVASVLMELSTRVWVTDVALAATVGSAALWVAFFVDRCLEPGLVRKDFEAPRTAFAYGAFQMTFLFCWLRLAVPHVSQTAGVGGLWVGAGAQLVIMLAFLRGCYRERCWPEPLWNPPLCDACVTAIVAAMLWHGGGLTNVEVLLFFSFGVAVVCVVLAVPPQVYRVLASDDVAANTSVGVLQAPVSLTALTWGVMQRARMDADSKGGDIFGARSDAYLSHFFLAASTAVFWITVYATWRRRRPILEKGFGIDWANFVFPTCSSAVAVLQYTSARPHDPAATSWAGMGTSWARVYAFAVGALALTIAAGVTLGVAFQALRDLLLSRRRHLAPGPLQDTLLPQVAQEKLDGSSLPPLKV